MKGESGGFGSGAGVFVRSAAILSIVMMPNQEGMTLSAESLHAWSEGLACGGALGCACCVGGSACGAGSVDEVAACCEK